MAELQSTALPLCYRAVNKNARRLGGRMFGAGNRVRTGDLNLGKVALYQLSYSRGNLCLFTYLAKEARIVS